MDTVGVFAPQSATWYLRNSNSAGAPDVAPFAYGMAGFVPTPGDWNGDGIDTVGAFDPAGAVWYLRDSNSPGAPSVPAFAYGVPGWLPASGANGGVDLLQASDDVPTRGAPADALSEPALRAAVGAALARLEAAGVDAATLTRLRAAQFQVADLPGGTLGATSADAHRILIDADGGGHGWFVDATPPQDEEFDAAESRVDLLTAMLHELGHLAGLDHQDNGAGGLMAERLAGGARLTGALDVVFAATVRRPR